MARARSEAAAARGAHAKERAQFHQLLLKNPNYFGNFPESGLEPSLELAGNTYYEQLTCVAYNISRDELEATVQIKRPTGYSGDLCTAGSKEYIRFYVDYGSGWEDAGLASFTAHDIPNSTDCAGHATKPLTYVVSYPHQPRRDWCGKPVLPNVRAILSWSAMPPAGQPNWVQPWGNTLDRHVQIRPRPWLLYDVAVAVASALGQQLKLPLELEYAQLEEIPLPEPPDPPVEQLAELYLNSAGSAKAAAVEPHRFALHELQAASGLALSSQTELSAKYAQLSALGIDLAAALAALDQTKGDVSYEELDCLGLDYNREWLVASLTIKRPTGYLGNLCQKGSYEYVAFWADWEDTCEWEYLDTVKVNVHDIATIPADGLHYWVGLPVGSLLAQHRETCKHPKLARIRAVLSWNSPPSTVNAELVPHWGNRLDAHVEIRPKKPVTLDAAIDVIGGVSVAQIDIAGNGMTKEGAVFAEWGSDVDPWMIGPLSGGGFGSTRLCPFGGRVNVQADVPPAFKASGWKYRLMTHEVGSLAPPAPVLTAFLTTAGISPPVWRYPDAQGYVSYLDPSENVYNMLGWWETATLGDGLWELWLEMVDSSFSPLGQTVAHRVQLDNTKPDADVSIVSGGDCKDFDQGDTINGTFSASDLHFGHFTLQTFPASLGPPNPSTARAAGAELPNPASWSLVTSTSWQPCGYVIRLDVYDRTIVQSAPFNSHNWDFDDTGFCLRKKA